MPTTRTPEQRARRMRNWGIFLVAYPIPGLVTVLFAYAIVSFILAQVATTGTAASSTASIAMMLKILLSLVGTACVLGIFIAMPIGIYLIARASTLKSEVKK